MSKLWDAITKFNQLKAAAEAGDHTAYEEYKHMELTGAPLLGADLIGLPCTYVIGSDSYAAEVIASTPRGRTIQVRLSKSGRVHYCSPRKNGSYGVVRGPGMIMFYTAETHLDPSF